MYKALILIIIPFFIGCASTGPADPYIPNYSDSYNEIQRMTTEKWEKRVSETPPPDTTIKPVDFKKYVPETY